MLQSKLLFMHSIHYEYAPKSFHNIFTKNLSREINYELRNADAYLVPAARIELFKKFVLKFLILFRGHVIGSNNKTSKNKSVNTS